MGGQDEARAQMRFSPNLVLTSADVLAMNMCGPDDLHDAACISSQQADIHDMLKAGQVSCRLADA